MFWMMCDFLKSQTVATAGFVDLADPHLPAARDKTKSIRPTEWAAAQGAGDDRTATLDREHAVDGQRRGS